MEFTADEIKMLAQSERDMDSGKLPFVINHSNRMLVSPEAMTELGLEIGQTISNQIALAISQLQLQQIHQKIAEKKANEALVKLENISRGVKWKS